MPTIITTEGEMKEADGVGLDYYQSIVGGLIQYVSMNDGGYLYCNEEGKLKGLQPNMVATMLCMDRLMRGDYIAGDVIVFEAGEEEC